MSSGQRTFALSAHHVTLSSPIDFDGWRDAARRLVIAHVSPQDVEWTVQTVADREEILTPPIKRVDTSSLKVPRYFIEAAQRAILHSDPQRISFLYTLLWRLQMQPAVLKIASDPDVRRLEDMTKAIRRDIHKMRAFIRFRKIGDDETYIAWFEPSHYILERNVEFFRRRFAGMNWSILTPYRSAHWNGAEISFSAGAKRRDVPTCDAADDLWRTYYRNIFNPARLKVKAMQAEMPKRYWRNLPEASLIHGMISGAEQATRDMIKQMPTAPSSHHATIQAKHWASPPQLNLEAASAGSLPDLRKQADVCRRCPLWSEATQTVFGEGNEKANLMFVGEQPGDQEDITGKPFVGPAGKLFDTVLSEAGIIRESVYVTNAVKHFKFEPRGKRRIHQKPNLGEIQACKWWLDHEIRLLTPYLLVALGATAAQSLLGRAVPITSMRGQIVKREDGLGVFLTIHPSFILRIRDRDAAQHERARFLEDFKTLRLHIP